MTKKVYGKGVHQAIPDNIRVFFDLFPFVPNQERLGDTFVEAVNLQLENGITRTPVNAGVVSLNNSSASVVKQILVNASSIIMQAAIGWDLVAKARSPNSAQSFQSALTQVVDNLILSHRRYSVGDMLYGGTSLAVVSPGATSATQTITKASCAPGLWYGANGSFYDIYDPTLVTKRNASPLELLRFSVDPSSATRTLTFGASVATTTSDVIVPTGTVTGAAYTTLPGLSVIAGQQGGNLFGLSQVTYPMFQSSVYDAAGALTMAKLDAATVMPLIRGFSGKLKLLCHPITFSNLAQEEAARIHLVGSQASGSVKVGYNSVTIVCASGANIEVEGSPWIKEGEAYLIPTDGSIKRVGACDLQLGGPSDPQPTWRRMEGLTGYSIPSYSLTAMFCAEPWKLTKITGIVNT